MKTQRVLIATALAAAGLGALVFSCSSTRIDVVAANKGRERFLNSAAVAARALDATPDGGAGLPAAGRLEYDQHPFIVDAHAHLFNALDLPIAGFARSLGISHGVPAVVVDNPTIVHLLADLECVLYQSTPGFQGASVTRRGTCERKFDPAVAQQIVKALQDVLSPAVDPCSSQAVLARISDSAARAQAAGLAEGVCALSAIERSLKAGGFAIPKTIRSLLAIAVNAFATTTNERKALALELAAYTPSVDVFVDALVDFDFWTERSVLHDIRNCDKMNAIDAGYAHLSISDQIEAHHRLMVDSLKGAIKANGRAFPQYVLPLVGYNPLRDVVAAHCPTDREGKARESSMALVQRAIEQRGFVGVKLYPPTGFLPTGNADLPEAGLLGQELDDALDRFFQYCEANEVPILAHANDSNGFGTDFGWRAGPWAWRRVLEKHPNLRISFGHFGELTGAADPDHRIDCLSWSDGFAQLMSIHDNVYADISFSPGATDDEACSATAKCPGAASEGCAARCQTEALLASLMQKTMFFSSNVSLNKVADRLLYGSDWWMTELSGPGKFAGYFERMKGMIDDVARLASKDKDATFSNAVLGTNALGYLGLDDSTHKGFQRLRSFICSAAMQAQQVPPPTFLPEKMCQ